MLKKSFFIIIIFSLFFPMFGNNRELTQQEQQLLSSNLNYLQYSLCKIKKSEDKAIAEDEYYSVINEIDMNSINNNELIQIYKKFLETCSTLKLKQNEKDFLKEINNYEINNAWKSAFSTVGSVFVPGQTWEEMVFSLIYTTTANIISVKNKKSNLEVQLNKSIFNLDQTQLETLYNAQTDFFNHCMILLGGNDIPGRILEDTFNELIRIQNNNNVDEKISLLTEKNIQESLKYFPPYWFELGNAYQVIGNIDEAIRCYQSFEKLKHFDVIKKDKTYIKLLKNKIQIYLGNSSESNSIKENALKNKSYILDCIDLINDNTLDSDIGEKQAYLAKIYYLIGDIDKAKECINYIITTKSVNSEYVYDAINLRLLIKSVGNDKENDYYRTMLNCNNIRIGGMGLFWEFLKEKGIDKETVLKKINSYVEKYVSKGFEVEAALSLILRDEVFYTDVYGVEKKFFDGEVDESFYDSDGLYINCPSNLLENRNIIISINNKKYYPKKVMDYQNNSLLWMPFDLASEKEPFFVSFYFTEVSYNSALKVMFYVEPIKYKTYEEISFAFDRMSIDLDTYNAEIALNFGKLLQKNKFKYHIQNIDKEFDKEIKNLRKQNKEANAFLTDAQLENEARRTLSKDINIDIGNLNSILKNIMEEYYNCEKVLYDPKIIEYGSSYYVCGLDSIYNEKTRISLYFTPLGDIELVEE